MELQTKKTSIKKYKVGVLVFPGVEVQDFAGPIEVFTNAKIFSDVDFEVVTCGLRSRWIYTENKTVKIKPKRLSCVKDIDIFIIPGGPPRVLKDLIKDEKFVRKAILSMQNTQYIMSVCTGAFLLAESGLLGGLRATTHYQLADCFTKMYGDEKHPKNNSVTLERDVRFVDNGHLLSTSGVTSGIDGSLHLLQKLTNIDVRNKVANFMQYAFHEKENWPEANHKEEGKLCAEFIQ